MGFLDNMRLLNGERLQKSAKAMVQINGKLTFSTAASELLKVADGTVKAFLVYAGEGNDLAMVPAGPENAKAFLVRSSGQTKYLAFLNHLRECGIEFRKQKVSYDITQVDEELDGKPIFRFEYHARPRIEGEPDADMDGETRGADAEGGGQ